MITITGPTFAYSASTETGTDTVNWFQRYFGNNAAKFTVTGLPWTTNQINAACAANGNFTYDGTTFTYTPPKVI